MPGDRPNGTLVIDYLELPHSGRFKYLLVMIDMFTRFCELVPFGEANAACSMAGLLYRTGQYGFSSVVQFGGGSHFENKALHAFLAESGMKASVGPPHHPQAQG